MATTKKPAVKSDNSKVKDSYGEEHEKLLLIAHKELPKLLSEELHAVAPLNEALAKQAPARKKEIERLIKEGAIPSGQEAIWRAIPDLQFTNAKIPLPKIDLGVTLHRYYGNNGTRKEIPEALSVVDFAIDLDIPKWQTGDIATPDPKKSLLKPVDGIEGLGHKMQKVRVLGIVFTQETTLGNALREIERTRDNGTTDSVRSNYGGHHTPYIICVINRPELFDVLCEKVDVLLIEKDRLLFDFGYLVQKISTW